MNNTRLDQQIQFILEMDKLKHVTRRSYLLDQMRLENSAEHSWHVSLIALVLAEYADDPIDTFRVLQMMLVHDIVEIDAGDTFLYDESANAAKADLEQQAADRLFSLLPGDQAKTYLELWQEFEDRETPDARFARGLDRLMPLLHNYYTQGSTWRKHGVRREQVLQQNSIIQDASQSLWNFAKRLIDEAVEKGYLQP